jgi:predicted esterase
MTKFAAVIAFLAAGVLHAQDRKSESGLDYRLTKPSGGGGRVPLIVMLHGTGGGRHVWGAWASAAVSKGYMVCLPMSTGVGTPQSGNMNGDNMKRWDFVDHPKLLSLVDELIRKEGADPKRIYLAGFSNGAWNTSALGLAHPDVFSAILVIGGGLPGQVWKGEEPKSMGVFILHGDKDGSVPVQNGRDMEATLKKAGFPNVVYKEFPGRGHVMFEEEIENFYKWLPKFYKSVRPGSNSTLAWVCDPAALSSLPEKKLALVYFYSAKDQGSPVVESFEMELFKDAGVIGVSRELLCLKLDRDQEAALAKELKVAGPAVLIVDRSKKILASWNAPTAAKTCADRIRALLKKLK